MRFLTTIEMPAQRLPVARGHATEIGIHLGSVWFSSHQDALFATDASVGSTGTARTDPDEHRVVACAFCASLSNACWRRRRAVATPTFGPSSVTCIVGMVFISDKFTQGPVPANGVKPYHQQSLEMPARTSAASASLPLCGKSGVSTTLFQPQRGKEAEAAIIKVVTEALRTRVVFAFSKASYGFG